MRGKCGEPGCVLGILQKLLPVGFYVAFSNAGWLMWCCTLTPRYGDKMGTCQTGFTMQARAFGFN